MKRLFALVGIGLAVGFWVYNAAEAHADTWAHGDADDNAAMLQEFADVVATVEQTYNTGPMQIDTAWLDPGTYAMAGPTGITVNKEWSTGTVDALFVSVNNDTMAGYHNAGCDAVATVAYHESAHVIDGRRGFLPRRRLMAAAGSGEQLQGQLAGYSFNSDGTLNAAEALAEAFQAVQCGSASPADRVIYGMLVN